MNAALAPAPPATSIRFVDNGDGTITDTKLGLVWSKATITSEEVNHAAAEKACADLDLAGATDWRLPSPQELFSLVDHDRSRPAIDTDAFPDTKSDWYWTNKLVASDPSYAWIVFFGGGFVLNGLRDVSGAFVRAVRSVPAGQ